MVIIISVIVTVVVPFRFLVFCFALLFLGGESSFDLDVDVTWYECVVGGGVAHYSRMYERGKEVVRE